jgi:tRNA nucleotidyltransferase (CCA-adding enzyme)
LVDPLNGLNDIKKKVLDTVKEPEKVFCSDGLRLLRLARFAGELDFTPTKNVIESARQYSQNLKDISVERIWAELIKILTADNKYSFSKKDGHYRALKVLDESRCLDVILPQLTLGRGMVQRSDYHNYDVLEHSLRCVLYSPKNIRVSALLHDVGKPLNMLKTGKYHGHDKSGAKLVKDILNGLKADKKTVEKTARLTRLHMADMDLMTKEGKVRRLIIDNYDILDDLLSLKQADYSACKDNLGVCPTVKKWKEILLKMKQENTPFTLKELKIDAKALIDMGYNGKDIGDKLKELLTLCQLQPKYNDEKFLKNKAQKDLKK